MTDDIQNTLDEPTFMLYVDPTPEELARYEGNIAVYRFEVKG
jgi:hypothetical protein